MHNLSVGGVVGWEAQIFRRKRNFTMGPNFFVLLSNFSDCNISSHSRSRNSNGKSSLVVIVFTDRIVIPVVVVVIVILVVIKVSRVSKCSFRSSSSSSSS